MYRFVRLHVRTRELIYCGGTDRQNIYLTVRVRRELARVYVCSRGRDDGLFVVSVCVLRNEGECPCGDFLFGKRVGGEIERKRKGGSWMCA